MPPQAPLLFPGPGHHSCPPSAGTRAESRERSEEQKGGSMPGTPGPSPGPSPVHHAGPGPPAWPDQGSGVWVAWGRRGRCSPRVGSRAAPHTGLHPLRGHPPRPGTSARRQGLGRAREQVAGHTEEPLCCAAERGLLRPVSLRPAQRPPLAQHFREALQQPCLSSGDTEHCTGQPGPQTRERRAVGKKDAGALGQETLILGCPQGAGTPPPGRRLPWASPPSTPHLSGSFLL